MSMEIYVLSDRRLASLSDWQEAIEAEGFGLQLATGRSLDDLRGHLPAQLGDEHAGFECDHWDAGGLMETYRASTTAIAGNTRSRSASAAMSMPAWAPTWRRPPTREPRVASSSSARNSSS